MITEKDLNQAEQYISIVTEIKKDSCLNYGMLYGSLYDVDDDDDFYLFMIDELDNFTIEKCCDMTKERVIEVTNLRKKMESVQIKQGIADDLAHYEWSYNMAEYIRLQEVKDETDKVIKPLIKKIIKWRSE